MNELDAIETINFEPLAAATARPDEATPDRTLIVYPRRQRGFDATTIVVSSVASGAFFAFAAFAALV